MPPRNPRHNDPRYYGHPAQGQPPIQGYPHHVDPRYHTPQVPQGPPPRRVPNPKKDPGGYAMFQLRELVPTCHLGAHAQDPQAVAQDIEGWNRAGAKAREYARARMMFLQTWLMAETLREIQRQSGILAGVRKAARKAPPEPRVEEPPPEQMGDVDPRVDSAPPGAMDEHGEPEDPEAWLRAQGLDPDNIDFGDIGVPTVDAGPGGATPAPQGPPPAAADAPPPGMPIAADDDNGAGGSPVVVSKPDGPIDTSRAVDVPTD